ncbi:MAG: hypothetical protein HN704_12780 [Bacteroidetes bacterium]|jgi:hypothetical protein|nr:hypothetical protein [Bacteroidota bacterium]MBT6685518.1 hypothetical protein [Bacteroidota bacterium]MBT7144981.1 hypothetical protein [Bacteroidota bacterium]MBT7492469.1 hypothetical protein [Bacteroidota bacterium]
MLPKFLIADNSLELPETLFIIHNEEPRCIIGFDVDDFNSNRKIDWIDDKPEDDRLIEILLVKVEQYLEDELENQDMLYEQMENEEEE